MKITLFAVRHWNKVYEFREPVEVIVYKINGAYRATWPAFSVYAFGATTNDLWKHFANDINFLWTSYALYKGRMDKGAVRLRNKLLNIITVREIA